MSVTRRQLWIAGVIGLVVMVVAAPVLGQVLSGFIAASGTIPISSNTDTTVRVSGINELQGDPWPYDNTVEVVTDQGNMTVIGNGQANASVDAGDIEGDWTRVSALDVSGTTVIFDPADKAQIAVNGDATAVEWTDYAIDDGASDMVITGTDGGSSDVTFYGLSSDLTVTARNATGGTPLDVAQTDSTGKATFTIPHSTKTIELVSGDKSSTPELTNPSPTTNLNTPPSELRVDVDDEDFPDDNVSVTIDYDGTTIHSESVSGASTVSTTNFSTPDGGVHTWTVNATDRFGNTELETYEFTVPSSVYIYNETPNSTGQHELLDGVNITVGATITGEDGYASKQTVTNGEFDMTGLDAGQSYVFTAETEDYYVRSVYIPNTYEQNALFLLNKSQNSTQNFITLTDRTGRYSDNPALSVQRVINSSNVSQTADEGYKWVTVTGDRMGASNELVTNLQQDQRYRFKIQNADGDVRYLGEYIAETDNQIDLEIGSISYEFVNESSGYQWDSTIDNSSGSPFIRFAYDDFDNNTNSVQMEIRYRDNGTVIRSETFRNGPYGEIVYTEPISQNQYNNYDFEVAWEADRDDETVGAVRPVGGQRVINFGALDAFWITAGFSLIALVLAFAVGAGISAGAGGLAVAGWMGIAWYIGAVPTELGAGAIILAFLVAAWTTVNEQEQQVIQ